MEIFKGFIDVLILCILKKEDSYGYKIAKEIKEKSNSTYKIGEGTLYTALKRLEKNLSLESYWITEEERSRKYYKITQSGEDLLKQKISNINNLNILIEEITK